MLQALIARAQYALQGERGVSNVEVIVWISVVLMIATVLFAFKDAVVGFLNRANQQINKLNVQ